MVLRSKTHTILVFLPTITMLLSACAPRAVKIQEERAVNVETMTVDYGDLQVRTTLVGRVAPLEEARLTSRISGTVARVHVFVGDTVQEGQTLVSLDQRDIKESIRQSEAAAGIERAAVATAEAGLAMVEEQHRQAIRELNRVKALYDQGATTRQELERAEMAASENALDSTRAQIEQARAQLNRAQVALEVAKADLIDTVIQTPISGVVTEVNARRGEILTGWAVTVARLNPVVVKISVSEQLASRFEIGQEVIINIPAARGRVYSGTVHTIAPVPAAGTRRYPMEVHVGNPEGAVKAGMFAEVELTIETRENVIIVPSEVVVIRGGRAVVFLVDGDRAIMREVVVGIDDGQSAEIVSGLDAKSRILLGGQDSVEDGSLINDVTNKGI